MPTLIITVDLECCRCSSKIQKILCCIQDRGEFVIDKIVYEKDKVFVSGPFDANELSCKLCCKAGRIIKNIEVAKPPPIKSEPSKPSQTHKIIYPYPYPYLQPAWPCSCPPPYCQCHAKPPPPPPPPESSKPLMCQCPTWSSCQCCGYPPLSMPPSHIPRYPYPMVVCDDSPPYGACAIM
ncbi:hypothetical protein ACP4OV_010431 [Aristida adscensionis]